MKLLEPIGRGPFILSPPINKRSDEYGGPLQKGILIAQELEKRGIDEV
jgi:2,4-dienoyl-CoA reductase-like NADH-dependent reductase (Old Yellow Enzyme family)